MTTRRTHLLLEPEQHQTLAQIADREGRSVSDLAREIVQEGIEHRQQSFVKEKHRRLRALERPRQVRQTIPLERNGMPLDLNIATLVDKLREERDDRIISRRD
jgi:hypothetical protein